MKSESQTINGPIIPLTAADKNVVEEALHAALLRNITSNNGINTWNEKAVAIALDKAELTKAIDSSSKEDAYLVYQNTINNYANAYLKHLINDPESRKEAIAETGLTTAEIANRATILHEATEPKKVYVEEVGSWALEQSIGNVFCLITESEKFSPAIIPSLEFGFDSTSPANRAQLRSAISTYKAFDATFSFFAQTVDLSTADPLGNYDFTLQTDVNTAIIDTINSINAAQPLNGRDEYIARMVYLGLGRSAVWAEMIDDQSTVAHINQVMVGNYSAASSFSAKTNNAVQTLTNLINQDMLHIEDGAVVSDYVNIVADLGGTNIARAATAEQKVKAVRKDGIDLGKNGERLIYAGIISDGKKVTEPSRAYDAMRQEQIANVTKLKEASIILQPSMDFDQAYHTWVEEKKQKRHEGAEQTIAPHTLEANDKPKEHTPYYNAAGNHIVPNKEGEYPKHIPLYTKNNEGALEPVEKNGVSSDKSVEHREIPKNAVIEKKFAVTLPPEPKGYQNDAFSRKLTTLKGDYRPLRKRQGITGFAKGLMYGTGIGFIVDGISASSRNTKHKRHGGEIGLEVKEKIISALTEHWGAAEHIISFDDVLDNFYPGQFSASSKKNVNRSLKRNDLLFEELTDTFYRAVQKHYPDQSAADQMGLAATMVDKIRLRSTPTVSKKYQNPQFRFYFSEEASTYVESKEALEVTSHLLNAVFRRINPKNNATHEQASRVFEAYMASEGQKFNDIFSVTKSSQGGKTQYALVLQEGVSAKELQEYNDFLQTARLTIDGEYTGTLKMPQTLYELSHEVKEANKARSKAQKNQGKTKDLGDIQIDHATLELGAYHPNHQHSTPQTPYGSLAFSDRPSPTTAHEMV